MSALDLRPLWRARYTATKQCVRCLRRAEFVYKLSLSLLAQTACRSVSWYSRVTAVGRPEQLRLPGPVAVAAPVLRFPRIISAASSRSVCGEGRVRKTFYLSALGRAGRLAGRLR